MCRRRKTWRENRYQMYKFREIFPTYFSFFLWIILFNDESRLISAILMTVNIKWEALSSLKSICIWFVLVQILIFKFWYSNFELTLYLVQLVKFLSIQSLTLSSLNRFVSFSLFIQNVQCSNLFAIVQILNFLSTTFSCRQLCWFRARPRTHTISLFAVVCRSLGWRLIRWSSSFSIQSLNLTVNLNQNLFQDKNLNEMYRPIVSQGLSITIFLQL